MSATARPGGVTALSVFFLAGAAIALVSATSLLFPGSFLEPMWRLNSRARQAFAGLEPWAIALLGLVGVACLAAAIGLWRGERWGYRAAIGLLAVNLVGDVVNTLSGTERRAVVGIPVASGLLAYLATRRVRRFLAE